MKTKLMTTVATLALVLPAFALVLESSEARACGWDGGAPHPLARIAPVRLHVIKPAVSLGTQALLGAATVSPAAASDATAVAPAAASAQPQEQLTGWGSPGC